MHRKTGLILLILAIIPSVALAGWGVGNGGDWLRLQFAKAKEHAAYVTMRVSRRSLKGFASAEVTDWIMENKGALAADILSTSHKWHLEEKPTCAWTMPEDGAKVEFSYETCRKTTSSFLHAATLLVHESVHHFGITDEEFADAVALAIYNSYKAGKIDWLDVESQGAPSARSKHTAVWTGTEMVVFGGLLNDMTGQATNTGARYNPETGEWKPISSQGAPERYGHLAVWADGKMVVWGGLASGNGTQNQEWLNDGAIWDAETDRWTPIANPIGPATLSLRPDYTVQSAVFTGTEVLIYGGVVRSGSGSSAAPGLVLKVANGQLSPMPMNGAPAKRQSHTAVWTGSKMIVWGGLDENNRASTEGALFNPATGHWSAMGESNAPAGLDGHVAVWTGSKMQVFGGYYSSREMKGIGGTYDPETNSWDSYKTEIAFGRTGHSGVWTGEELLVFGGRSRRLRVEFETPVGINPETNSIRALSTMNSPRERYDHTAVWTGSRMIIWGGITGRQIIMGDGSSFYP